MTDTDEALAAQWVVADELAALAAVGGPDQIAAHLQELGITGWPVSAARCPVARYVQHQTGERITVVPSGRLTPGVYRLCGESVRRPLPAAVSEFANRFDDREYPALIAIGPAVEVPT